MKTLVIEDLATTQVAIREEGGAVRSLSHAEMQLIQGARAIAVLVDGRPGGVVDDFQLALAIFKGDIGVTYK